MSCDAAARKIELQQPLARGLIIRRRKLPLLCGIAREARKVSARTMHFQVLGDDIPGAIDSDANRDFDLAMDRIACTAGDGGNLFMHHRRYRGLSYYRGLRRRRRGGLLRSNRIGIRPYGAAVASQHPAPGPDREQHHP